MRGAVKALPPEHLRAIDLSYCLGPTHAGIVDFSGLSRGMVKSRLRLGLKKVSDRPDAPSMGFPVGESTDLQSGAFPRRRGSLGKGVR